MSAFAPTAEQVEALLRGTSNVISPEELAKKIERSRQQNKPMRVKLGIDPTTPDIHLGHTVPLRKLRQFQDLGHTVILIIGDATAMIGDPTGRSATRPRLTAEQIAANAKTYQDQFFKIVSHERCEVVRNADWLGKLSFGDIVSLTSKFTVARLIERDDFAKRLKAGEPLGLHELLYPLMQGYDSVMVKADIEIGATEQLYNLLVGRALQESEGQEPQVVMTLPILVGLDGKQKMSKSLGNHVGITESPVEMFGKLMSIPDALIVEYMRSLTKTTEEAAMAWQGKMKSGELNPRDAKAEVAREIVKTYHGAVESVRASAEFDRVFKEKQAPTDMAEVTLVAADLAADGTIEAGRLVAKAGLAPSNREAFRLATDGAVTYDGTKVSDARAKLTPRTGAVLQVGPRRFVKIRVG